MVTPLVERRLVSLPPALLVFAVVAAGALLGLPGVLLGAPLTVVFYVLVKRLYVREALGQPTTVPGEDAA
jgi:predicted PurR-regulated permease PerM